MNNELRRKITSLTLMTIMLAGGMVMAAPGMEPANAANANLYVSTDKFGGPMIVEVVINDQNYRDDTVEAMPSVTFDGNDLVMAQGSDGSWYAYVAETSMVEAAVAANVGFVFGVIDNTPDDLIGDPGFSDSAVVYAPGADELTVLTSPKSLSTTGNGLGQIEVMDNAWPFIQTFDFTDDANIKVVYESTPHQTEIIVFDDDMDDFASFSTDRTTYPHNADIHLVIDDMQLNIDPTDEDSWTFNVDGTSYYRDSIEPIDGNVQNDLNYGDNGFLKVTFGKVIESYSNYDDHATLNGIGFVTVTEDAPNNGIFENTDAANRANLITTNDKIRGFSGVIDYNDQKQTILVDYFGGVVIMDESGIGSSWSSGEPLDVILRDQDENENTKIADDFDVSDSRFEAIPAIKIGNPLTLEFAKSVTIEASATTRSIQIQIDDLLAQNATKSDEYDDALKVLTDNPVDSVELQNKLDLAETYSSWVSANRTLAEAVALSNSADSLILFERSQIALELFNALSDEIGEIQFNQQLVDNLQQQIDDLTSKIKKLIDDFDNPSSTVEAKTVLISVETFSGILSIDASAIRIGSNAEIIIDTGIDTTVLKEFADEPGVHTLINYDIRSLNPTSASINVLAGTLDDDGLIYVNSTNVLPVGGNIILTVQSKYLEDSKSGIFNIVFDVFTFGQSSNGERYNDAIYRLELEETSASSGEYIGTVEYIMLNQINIFQPSTFSGITTIGDEVDVIVHEDLTDEDAIAVIYLDIDGQGVNTQVSSQVDAPTYSGIVSFNDSNYKVADTVTVTIDDADLNTDSDTIDIYTVIDEDVIALADNPASLLFDVTFDDKRWESCTVDGDKQFGLSGSLSTLIETSRDSGMFEATFQIPAKHCTSIDKDGNGELESVTGLDLEVNYIDFRDASGETIEVGASAGIGSNTGSVSLDRTVYPVPFGNPSEGPSYFAVHTTGFDEDAIGESGTYLSNGDLTIHVRVNDPDYDVSGNGEDTISEKDENGPIKIMIIRSSNTVLLATAGADRASSGLITLGTDIKENTIELGPIKEIAPDAGIFELDMTIRYTDGPASSQCPASNSLGHIDVDDSKDRHCILQGDILQVEYTDPTDASGSKNTVTDSATFDLRNGVLQSDKSVYIIGSDMILTLIEPDLDLDNDGAETYSLDLVEWDSDAATVTMGNLGDKAGVFDPEPSNFRETGDSTGIFQIVIEIPESIGGDNLERGEEIELEYTDWGPAGAKYVGEEDEDVNLTIFSSNFGATVELDQKVYSWTDKVYITVVAPDHNFDSDLVDEIGNTSNDPIKIYTRSSDLDNYKLVESGTDTGIFTGEVILTGFKSHDADGDGITGDATGITSDDDGGPTDGLLPTDNDDGLTVSFEFSEDETVVSSSLIRWNIGETQWLEASYPASGTGVVRIIDPDMNLNPEAVDNFGVDIWSDSDAGGISLTVTETNEATGIFEGTVFFTVTDQSSGHRLRVAEGDTVTAEYEDNTLPDPYTTADELDITATTLIGTVVPPLERAPASHLRTVDAFGSTLDGIMVGQQVLITADVANGQDRDQPFAYLIQIQNEDGITVSLAWITGSFQENQQMSPSLSWLPEHAGSFTATAFVWESVDNPTALSPPVSATIIVRN